MASFYPVPTTRSTQLLSQTRLIHQLHTDQLALQRLQTQISTGQRITAPGEDPSAAQRGQTLQRLLEIKAQAKISAQSAQSYLDATDQALANVAKLVSDVRGEALTAASDTSTPQNRAAAAQQVAEAIGQLLNTANQNFRGRYLFAGSKLEQVPFERTAAGIVYAGNVAALQSFVDLDLAYATNASGAAVFGAFSSQVEGTTDLDPQLTADTPLSALIGGQGVNLGSIQISDGTSRRIVDLSSAATVGDVAALIEANPPEGRTVTVTITSTGLNIAIDAGGGGNFSIREVAGGTTAAALRIATPPLGNGLAPVVGGDLNPTLRLTTRLADLQVTPPLDLTAGLQIVNGGQTYVIDTSGAQTVEQLLNAINKSPANVLAQIAPGDRLVVRSRLSGADFAIGENGGTLATQLGLRSLTADTALTELNHGNGVASSAGTDFTIHRKDGTDLAIDVSSAVTVGDVIDLINNDAANQDPLTRVVARLAVVGNGIELFDGNTTGTDTLRVTRTFGSHAANDLGLIPAGADSAAATTGVGGDTLTGTDTHLQEVSGLFNSLLRLQDSLTDFSHEKLARAIALLDEDFDRVVFARSEVGTRNQTIDTIQAQLEDEEIELRDSLADAIETTLPEAISNLASRQAALQASLQLAAQVFQISLLNYL